MSTQSRARGNGVHHQQWRLEGHPAAIAAFRKGLQAWEKAEN